MSKNKTLSRKELYDLIWSEPMKTLAEQFGLSDVGMAKVCKRSNIPKPPRGFWAKLAAGKNVRRQGLPDRGPGMSDVITIGGSQYDLHFYRRMDDEILAVDPTPHFFDVSIEEVRAKVKAHIKSVTMPVFPKRAHRAIRKLLEKDEEKRKKRLASPYPYLFDKPLFDNSFEKRRLKILNAVFTALEKAGMKPNIRGGDASELSVQVNDTRVEISLESASVTPERYPRRPSNPQRTTDDLRFSVFCGGVTGDVRRSWVDGKGDNRLEKYLLEIVVSIIVAGEEQYREICQWCYEREVERKKDLIAEIQKQKAEAGQKERERQAALDKARMDRLLSDADAMRKATDIRQYVESVLTLWGRGKVDISSEEIMLWKNWASAQADQIDPVRSGQFLKSLKGNDT
ncbi:hypothetical protein GQF03_17395 [Sneathiella chungangensis]|uniref:Uncharacterized protein n=1 Tax=Sneathiella chungangensis TaxID=1418234 RepID=A0A845MKP2_9PROT|nr:hypothetical protein [Sneathiella chungangensis]MZR24112.1 hypothetical protein [Sneathiella chungangensis]